MTKSFNEPFVVGALVILKFVFGSRIALTSTFVDFMEKLFSVLLLNAKNVAKTNVVINIILVIFIRFVFGSMVFYYK
jgi:hypothetical protein